MFCVLAPQELHTSAQALQEERVEVKRRLEEATARVIQLEEDLIGVTQRGLQKETELDGWVRFLERVPRVPGRSLNHMWHPGELNVLLSLAPPFTDRPNFDIQSLLTRLRDNKSGISSAARRRVSISAVSCYTERTHTQ